MKIAFLIAMFLAASTGETEENNVRVVSLMGGVEMEIRKIQFPRILPTAYYDQALSSIPGLYPDSEIVAKYVMDTLGRVKMQAIWFDIAKNQERLKGKNLLPVKKTLTPLHFRKDTSSGGVKN